MSKFWHRLFKFNQSGEIATILTLVSSGKNLFGFFLGKFGKKVKEKSQSYQSKANPKHCAYSKFIKVDHTDSNFFSILIESIANRIAKYISPVNTVGSFVPM